MQSNRYNDMHLIVIGGPTATGKTRLAVELAHRLGTCVLSADSRKVYRGLDIGTGKDLAEYGRFGTPVPYHLIDIADPREIYSLYRYQCDFFSALRGLRDRGVRSAVVAGGSGLYIEACLKRYVIANVPEDAVLRRGLMERTREELDAELARLAPDLHARTDRSSKKRLARALEIQASGWEPPSLPRETPEFTYSLFAVEIERETLYSRIAERLDARLRAGMIEEVESLMQAGVTAERLEALGMEYREITAFLLGRKDARSMREDLLGSIRQLSRRQQTWFRGMARRGLELQWIGPDAIEAIVSHVNDRIPHSSSH